MCVLAIVPPIPPPPPTDLAIHRSVAMFMGQSVQFPERASRPLYGGHKEKCSVVKGCVGPADGSWRKKKGEDVFKLKKEMSVSGAQVFTSYSEPSATFPLSKDLTGGTSGRYLECVPSDCVQILQSASTLS